MKIDSETGEIKSVSYEQYEALKEELEKAKEIIWSLKEEKEDLIAELEQLKKDSITGMTESK